MLKPILKDNTLKTLEDHRQERDKVDLSENDHYIENGRVVFTASFLLKRGYCCKSGCRHCPYGFTKTEDTGEPDVKASK